MVPNTLRAENFQFPPKGVVEIDDSNEGLTFDPWCLRVQIAHQDENRVVIDSRLFNRLENEVHRAGLVHHEWWERIGVVCGHKDSRAARYVNSHLYSKTFAEKTGFEMFKILRESRLASCFERGWKEEVFANANTAYGPLRFKGSAESATPFETYETGFLVKGFSVNPIETPKGFFMSGLIKFNPNGTLSEAKVQKEMKVGVAEISPQTAVAFSDAGDYLNWAKGLKKDVTVSGAVISADEAVRFHPNGAVQSGRLRKSFQWKGHSIKAGAAIEFDDQGKVLRADYATNSLYL